MARPAKPSISPAVAVTLTVKSGVSAATVRRWSVTARRRLPRLKGQISVVTVSPAVSQKLNQTYRGKDRPTNVLSFVHQSEAISGEIILCPAVIRWEARQQARAYRPYFQFLLGHGFIHLLGLDHQTNAQHRRWQRWERRLATITT